MNKILKNTPVTVLGAASKKALPAALFSGFIATACLVIAPAFADGDECRDPVTDWQPKEQLRQKVEAKGWEVKRIKVDDGCYEIKGYDRKGHEIEAKFSPASFEVIEFEIKFNGAGDASDYLDLGPSDSTRQPTKAKPKVTIK